MSVGTRSEPVSRITKVQARKTYYVTPNCTLPAGYYFHPTDKGRFSIRRTKDDKAVAFAVAPSMRGGARKGKTLTAKDLIG